MIIKPLKHNKKIYFLIAFSIILITVIALTYKNNNRINEAGKDLDNILQELTNQGISSEIIEGCGKAQVKFGGGETFCGLGFTGELSGTLDQVKIYESIINNLITANKFEIINNNQTSSIKNLTTFDYKHTETNLSCYFRNELNASSQGVSGIKAKYTFYCADKK